LPLPRVQPRVVGTAQAAEPWRASSGVVTALRVASLFAGCGGSSIGYRAAGMRVVYACEYDPLKARTYRMNAPRDVRVEVVDVREVRGADLPAVDVLDGSPPCQPFSTAG